MSRCSCARRRPAPGVPQFAARRSPPAGDDELAVHAEVVVVGDRAGEPVGPGRERQHLRGHRLAGVLRGRALTDLQRLALVVGLRRREDLDVVREDPVVARDDPHARAGDLDLLGQEPVLVEAQADRPARRKDGLRAAAAGGGEDEEGECGLQTHAAAHEPMLARRMAAQPRMLAALAVLGGAAAALGACGTQEVSVSPSDPPAVKSGADIFAARCGGCHTFSKAGTQGGATKIKDRERVDGPNFDARKETVPQVLYAIRNGGFSGAIMPENIVTGREAQAVAEFLAKYSGRKAAK
ncbi:MAG: cytochrome c [Actinobacteria bacterium]|nr:MAG: cytochrome c [Actinomycetota bacterium]